jgi:hypothetical protein
MAMQFRLIVVGKVIFYWSVGGEWLHLGIPFFSLKIKHSRTKLVRTTIRPMYKLCYDPENLPTLDEAADQRSICHHRQFFITSIDSNHPSGPTNFG